MCGACCVCCHMRRSGLAVVSSAADQLLGVGCGSTDVEWFLGSCWMCLMNGSCAPRLGTITEGKRNHLIQSHLAHLAHSQYPKASMMTDGEVATSKRETHQLYCVGARGANVACVQLFQCLIDRSFGRNQEPDCDCRAMPHILKSPLEQHRGLGNAQAAVLYVSAALFDCLFRWCPPNP